MGGTIAPDGPRPAPQGSRAHAERRLRGLLVLDFDGTLWRGNQPLEHYAAIAARGLAPAERAPYLAQVQAFLDGLRWEVVGTAEPPDDGWTAVARFAEARGATPDLLRAAFLETRERIAAGAFRLEVPAGLPEFLAWSRRWCAIALATNSPASSVGPVIEQLGLGHLLDDVATGAAKPGALVGLVEGWLGRFEASRERVMSVGDHYQNDIEPAARAGWFTAYITPWRWVPGPCSIVGTTLEEVLPGLREWVAAVVAADGPPAVDPRAGARPSRGATAGLIQRTGAT